MGLFKEIYCSACGQKTKPLLRTKLVDGDCLCFSCTDMIPAYMESSLSEGYTMSDYRNLIEYIQYSNSVLRPAFHETRCYYNIHLDAENSLFYIGNDIDENTVFLHLRNIVDFDLIFSAETFKESLFGDRVSGRILFRIEMERPYFVYETILDKNVKTKAKTTFFGSKVTYENPDGLDDFLAHFHAAWQADCEADYSYNSPNTFQHEPLDELQQAAALFMIDDLESVSLEKLKDQRNRLMKLYHPDQNTNTDPKYAQKINSAYETLKTYAEKERKGELR